MHDFLPSIISSVALLLAGAAFKFAYSMVQRVTSLETKISLYWGAVEKQMSQMLHSPHRPNLDALLDKNLSGDRLTRTEAIRLVELLQKLIETNALSVDEIAGAHMLIAVTIGKYQLEV